MKLLLVVFAVLTFVLLTVCIFLILSIISKLNSRSVKHDQNYEIRDLFDRSSSETRHSLSAFSASIGDLLFKGINSTNNQILANVQAMSEVNTQKISEMRESLKSGLYETRIELRQVLNDVRHDNNVQLERMRETVDEKLSSTLDERLTKSFNLISDRLEAVSKGLGEMHTLSDGVVELRKTLTNVKSRGTWGEISLESILSDILTPDQYEKNSNVGDVGDRGRVDFAIILPGSESSKVYLPIDVKFPTEDYQRMTDAYIEGDSENYNKSLTGFCSRVKAEAKRISEKYILPPKTTDFAVMYLPTEGLFAEVLKQRGLLDELQNTYKIIPAGPTNISAMLGVVRQGFKNITISKYSKEIYSALSTFKKEFHLFAEIVTKAQGQLNTASKSLEEAGKKTDTIKRKLEKIETISSPDNEEELPHNEF
ncbi:MAG: DNA recombination protein RmuC [Christensenellaceae bacterium]|jgi:DNA recombination protein RmuC|nr:DNA recombination protein RmuC [Christensenellaceae bacterium]